MAQRIQNGFIALTLLTVMLAACASNSSTAAHPPYSYSREGTRAKNITGWRCPFPSEADAAGINRGEAVLEVAIDAGGQPRWSRILKDSGYGFGQAAATCAMSATYVPARNKLGEPIQSILSPIRVQYLRESSVQSPLHSHQN